MSVLYMMCGLPGSGKSTLAQQIAEKENALIISTNKIREIICGDDSDQSKNRQVFDIAELAVSTTLKLGKNVIIDATNKLPSERQRFLRYMGDSDIAVACVFDNNPELAKQHVKERVANGGRYVPNDVIDSMSKRYVYPTSEEGFVYIFHNKYPNLYYNTQKEEDFDYEP